MGTFGDENYNNGNYDNQNYAGGNTGYPGNNEEYSDTAKYGNLGINGYDYGYNANAGAYNYTPSGPAFDAPQGQHYESDVRQAKNALSFGILSLCIGILGIVLAFLLNRILVGFIYIFPIIGIISSIQVIRRDKGIGMAYAALIINIIACIPCGFDLLLWILNIAARVLR